MTKVQIFTTILTTILAGVVITLSFQEAPQTLPILVVATLCLVSLLATVLDISRLTEAKVNLAKGELLIKASPESVDLALKADAEQNAISQNHKDQPAATLIPLIETARHKDASIRTDADYLSLATEAWRAKNTENAMRYVYAGLERPISDNRITAALYSRLGTIETDIGLVELAEKHCRDAIRIDPGYDGAYSNLGNVLFKLTRFDEAEQAYRDAIRIDPNNTAPHNNLGILHSKLKRFDEAEQAFRHAIQIDLDYADAYHNLGVLLRNLERTDEADAAFARAKELKANAQ